MDALSRIPTPRNEPVLGYAPGSPERRAIESALTASADAEPREFLAAIGGQRRPGGGDAVIDVTMPSDHHHILGRLRQSSPQDAEDAIEAALNASEDWAGAAFADRAAVFLRAADLIAGPYRARINAATMLGQGKTVQQAEIDSACELIDFLRFNVSFAEQIYEIQPESSPGVWNRMDYRPLGGFVYAITPFNFTAIAGNLPTSPAIMGNPVIWKPSVTQQASADVFMEVLEKAGLPGGVINMLPGHGAHVSEAALNHPDLAGIHFTGSTRVFQGLWSDVGTHVSRYRSYPRIVGETGGKDFVVAHPSADAEVVTAALLRGAFEYSGQKCSAASRAYLPRSLWDKISTELIDRTEAIKVGDVRDFTNFTSAVIDQRAYTKLGNAIAAAQAAPDAEVVAGGQCDDSEGWFVRPTLVTSDNPDQDIFSTEYFGPFLGIFVYPDADFEKILAHVEKTSSYALTGSIMATDRAAIASAQRILRNAAGNFYINDKPTGAVVGQQPFGGGRASGTNDKAGSMWNLIRWTSPRAIKETFVAPTSIEYPHMD